MRRSRLSKNGRRDEAALVVRETVMKNLEQGAAVAQAISGTYQTIFDKMFANRQTRETMVDSITKQHPMQGGYGFQSATDTHSNTVDRTDVK